MAGCTRGGPQTRLGPTALHLPQPRLDVRQVRRQPAVLGVRVPPAVHLVAPLPDQRVRVLDAVRRLEGAAQSMEQRRAASPRQADTASASPQAFLHIAAAEAFTFASSARTRLKAVRAAA